MATRKKKHAASPTPKPAKLQAFHHRIDDRFSFSRFYWERSGPDRESMTPNFDAKQRPPDGGEESGPAAATQILLPADAPQDYFSVGFLVRHYEASLPIEETIAYAQLTIRFPTATNLHAPFELARNWAIQNYCSKGLPVVAFLHNPAIVGSEKNPGHVHLAVIPRRVTVLGWAGMARDIANDASRIAAWQSWCEYLATANSSVGG